MRKKWIVMGTGIGVGALLLAASGLSAMAGGESGYDAWKSALKTTKSASSIGGNVSITLTDNGEQRIGVEAAFKKNGEDASASVKLDAGKASQQLSAYHQDGKMILKTGDSDVYRVAEGPAGDGAKRWHKSEREGKMADPELAAGIERVMDALAGNLKDRVELDANADGSKQVSLHLSGNQVPVAVNAIGSMLLRHASDPEAGGPGWADRRAKSEGGDNPLFHSELKPELPKLTQNIRVEAINLDAKIDADGYFDEETAEIRIVGQDAAGTPHDVVIRATIDLNGLNATTPDTVDLTGKQVEKLERPADMHKGHDR